MNIEDERPIKPFNTNFNAAQTRFEDDHPTELRIDQEEEEEKQIVTNIVEDERPLSGKGSYKFTGSAEKTPAKQLEEVTDIEVRSRTHTASSKGKSVDDERPLKGAATYNIQDEQPISSKGSYDYIAEEKPISTAAGKISSSKTSKGKASVTTLDERPIGQNNSMNFDEKPLTSQGAYNMMDERPIGGGAGANFGDERPLKSTPFEISEHPPGSFYNY